LVIARLTCVFAVAGLITMSAAISSFDRPRSGPYDAGWKDTVDVRSAEAVEIVTRFTDYPGTFLLHCHNLEHEDMAMMADFVTNVTMITGRCGAWWGSRSPPSTP
jgi:FtsP/CotA-like multicopper oxidase with cupredoxin domain